MVSDCGLNGSIVHGVYTEPPPQATLDLLVNTQWVLKNGFHMRISGVTGYQNTQVLEMELNSKFRVAGVGWDGG